MNRCEDILFIKKHGKLGKSDQQIYLTLDTPLELLKRREYRGRHLALTVSNSSREALLRFLLRSVKWDLVLSFERKKADTQL